jgi:uncharacterized protein YgbK (DUF1537 family)
MSISLQDIRLGGPNVVSEKLQSGGKGQTCIVNAVSYRDLEVLVMGLLLAEKAGKSFLYRTSATFVPLRAGLPSGKAFVPYREDLSPPYGALIVVGSHVPKTTRQLERLLSGGAFKSIEVNVEEILADGGRGSVAHVVAIAQRIDQSISSGHDIVLYTSRKLLVGEDTIQSLQINASVSDFLVRIVRALTVRPSYILAKGGITSSDIASRGLGVEQALILGAVIPGVPVWRLGSASKFPGMMYVVFPGNVGDDDALLTVGKKFNG